MQRLWQPPSGLVPGTRRRVGPLHGTRETLRARREIMSTLFDQAQRICRGDSPPPPVARLIGFTLTSIAPGQARIAFDAGAQHANPMGTLHGGILCDVADAAMGMAFVTTLRPDESFTTMSLTINFFRPVWEARLRFEARVVNRSKNTGYLECDITDPEGKLIAKATSTC